MLRWRPHRLLSWLVIFVMMASPFSRAFCAVIKGAGSADIVASVEMPCHGKAATQLQQHAHHQSGKASSPADPAHHAKIGKDCAACMALAAAVPAAASFALKHRPLHAADSARPFDVPDTEPALTGTLGSRGPPQSV